MTRSHFRRVPLVCLIVTLAAVPLLLGGPPGGDIKDQQPKHPVKNVPPAPPLSAEQALKTFRLPAGWKMEIVAADPMVEHPVACAYDADGRMYVVEMRGYMNDVTGSTEKQPLGRVSRLEDTNGDGRMDKSTVFLDKLVMPRAIAIAGDGVLIAEPPNLWFCRDTNGDGVADEKTQILKNYGGQGSPEHTANGLTWGIDNWLYSCNYSSRIRPPKPDPKTGVIDYAKGKWQVDSIPANGQWGLSFDDIGRMYTNSNSSHLRVGLLPPDYAGRNPFYQGGSASASLGDNKIYPGRVTPGVNRGYNSVGPDGKIHSLTAACGPLIYRGDAYPAEFYGNSFVCEPSTHLLKRSVLTEKGITLTAKGETWKDGEDQLDFLCSTDERFRPVNLYTAPDGTMHIVDMYHGILQHKIFLTTYLRLQVLERKLDQPDFQGRIYRLVHASTKPRPQPKLSKTPAAELVKHLSHPNAFWRETAHRLLVERRDTTVVPQLKALLAAAKDPSEKGGPDGLAALHALYVLDGIGALDEAAHLAALRCADPRVRAAAVRLADVLLVKPEGLNLRAAVVALKADADPHVQAQLLLSLAPVVGPDAADAVFGLLSQHVASSLHRDAAMTGLAGRELDLLGRVFSDATWDKSDKGRPELVKALAVGVVAGRSADSVERLFELAGTKPANDWRVQAIVTGIGEAPKTTKGLVSETRPVRLRQQPAGLARIQQAADAKMQSAMKDLEEVLTWPGKPGYVAPKVPPLTPEQEARYQDGKVLYANICGTCHQPSGLGMEGLAPPLLGSDWVLGSETRLAHIALRGVRGPIVVNKTNYDLEMPGLFAIPDDQLANILTYIRREWGHEASAVDPATVAKARKASDGREDMYTAEELKKIQ